MIKFKTKNIISLSDWDDLVQTTYGKPDYVFQQQNDCQERGTHDFTVPVKHPYDYENDTVPEEINGNDMGVSFAAWLARDPKEWNGDPSDRPYIDLFWNRNFYPSIDMLANDLHEKGLLPAGEYVINIDW